MIYEDLEVSGSLRGQGITRSPSGTRANRPVNPETGSLYMEESTSGSFLTVYHGHPNNDDGWVRVSKEVDPVDFKYRHILTHSYLAGGYKNSSPWKNVHRTVNATDQTSHIGELLDYPANYTSGACSRYILFIWSVNTDGAHKGPTTKHGTFTSAINMVNETNYVHQTKFDILNTRSDVGTLFQETDYAWIFAGGTTIVEKFDLENETIMSLNYTLNSVDGSGGASGFSDENFGYGFASGGSFKMNFRTETFVTKPSWSAHGQQKGISSKVGKGYAGNEGTYNGGYNLRRWSNTSDTNIGNVAKPHPNCGEENFALGQDSQYMLGNYDGTGQNNTSWKFNYSTDTGTTNIPGLAPAVNAGTSSGHCGWR